MGKLVRSVAVVTVCVLLVPLLTSTPASAVEEHTAQLVQRIDLARLDPPSSDPAGITYLPSSGRLLVVDCNIDEASSSWDGTNLWEMSRSGSLRETGTTKRYTDEPTGVSFDEATSTLYVSDDDRARIFIVEAGGDGRFGTSDDRVSSFSTSGFGSGDPEDVTYDSDGEALFVVDGVAREVYRVPQRSDGTFDPGRATHFDMARYGAGDPEGIVYDAGRRSLFVLDYRSKAIYEVGTDGRLRTEISVSAAKGQQLAGLTIAPASNGRGMSLWIVDRGVNNAMTKADNDGMLYEMSVNVALGRPLDDGTSLDAVPVAPGDSPSDSDAPDGTPQEAGGSASLAGGYRMAASDGSVLGFGDAMPHESTGALKLAQPIVGSASTGSGRGWWLVGADGGVFAFGDAEFRGSAGAIRLRRPIVGMASAPSGRGYWLVASDGGVFSFGDAGFHGSTGGIMLAQPIVGMAPTPSGDGYWLVASDGGMFAFGDAAFHGSTGNVKLAQPIVGVAPTPSGDGYWLVASDGGMFAFGDAPFLGSTGNVKLAQPIVGMAPTPSGDGYWLVASDGGMFAFGDAPFLGSTGERPLGQSIVALSPS